MSKIKKVFNCEIKQIGEESERVLRFIGSDETPDRDEDIIEAAGWKCDEYMKNPVFLWAHDYSMPPVGKAIKVEKDLIKKCLMFDIKFPTLEELSSDTRNPSEHAKFVDTVYNLYKGGYLSATSVGFRGVKFKARDDDEMNSRPEWQRGRRYMEQSLLELSAVPVPSNPNALQQAKSAGIDVDKVERELNQLEAKKVIPYKKYPPSDEGTAWDGPTEIAAAEVSDLKLMCAWYDDTAPDVKQSYKLPHHVQADKNTVWRGVMAAMGALFGARGGVDIPEEDRKGVYSHLAKHYDDFGKTAPEFKSYTDIELKSMFPVETKKPDLQGNPSVYDIMDTIRLAINPAGIYVMGGPWIEDLYPTAYPSGSVVVEKNEKHYLYQYEYKDGVVTLSSDFVELEETYKPKGFRGKSGASLSRKNKEMLDQICKEMEGGSGKLRKFIDTAGMEDEPMITANMTADMTASMTASMTAGTTMTMPMMEPMMTATRTAPAGEEKTLIDYLVSQHQALDEIKSQVLLLFQKMTMEPKKPDANKVEIDLDAIEYAPTETKKDAAQDELDIEPGELKNMIKEIVKNSIQGGNKR